MIGEELINWVVRNCHLVQHPGGVMTWGLWIRVIETLADFVVVHVPYDVDFNVEGKNEGMDGFLGTGLLAAL